MGGLVTGCAPGSLGCGWIELRTADMEGVAAPSSIPRRVFEPGTTLPNGAVGRRLVGYRLANGAFLTPQEYAGRYRPLAPELQGSRLIDAMGNYQLANGQVISNEDWIRRDLAYRRANPPR